MVCNLHFPTGTTYFRIWNRRAISGDKTLPVSWQDGYVLRARINATIVCWGTAIVIN